MKYFHDNPSNPPATHPHPGTRCWTREAWPLLGLRSRQGGLQQLAPQFRHRVLAVGDTATGQRLGVKKSPQNWGIYGSEIGKMGCFHGFHHEILHEILASTLGQWNKWTMKNRVVDEFHQQKRGFWMLWIDFTIYKFHHQWVGFRMNQPSNIGKSTEFDRQELSFYSSKNGEISSMNNIWYG